MNLPRLLRETFPYLPEAGPVTREQRKIINAAADRIAQLEAENAELRHDIAKALGNHAADLTAETKVANDRR